MSSSRKPVSYRLVVVDTIRRVLGGGELEREYPYSPTPTPTRTMTMSIEACNLVMADFDICNVTELAMYSAEYNALRAHSCRETYDLYTAFWARMKKTPQLNTKALR